MLIFRGVMWMVLVQGIGFDKSALFFDTSRGFLTVAEKKGWFAKSDTRTPTWKMLGCFFVFFHNTTRWWFQTCFIFTPILGEMIQFDSGIFCRWAGSTTN